MKQTILDGRMIYLKPHDERFACRHCSLHTNPTWKGTNCPWVEGRLVCSAEHSVFVDPLDVITERLVG